MRPKRATDRSSFRSPRHSNAPPTRPSPAARRKKNTPSRSRNKHALLAVHFVRTACALVPSASCASSACFLVRPAAQKKATMAIVSPLSTNKHPIASICLSLVLRVLLSKRAVCSQDMRKKMTVVSSKTTSPEDESGLDCSLSSSCAVSPVEETGATRSAVQRLLNNTIREVLLDALALLCERWSSLLSQRRSAWAWAMAWLG